MKKNPALARVLAAAPVRLSTLDAAVAAGLLRRTERVDRFGFRDVSYMLTSKGRASRKIHGGAR